MKKLIRFFSKCTEVRKVQGKTEHKTVSMRSHENLSTILKRQFSAEAVFGTKSIGIGILVFALTGCSFAPQYHRPAMPIPEHFKEPGQWVEIKSTPRIVAPNGWWHAFHDPVLNDLENQLNKANQDLKLAYAHFQEAVSLVQVARSYFSPRFKEYPMRIDNKIHEQLRILQVRLFLINFCWVVFSLMNWMRGEVSAIRLLPVNVVRMQVLRIWLRFV